MPINEPSTRNCEKRTVFVLTAAIDESGGQMAIWSLDWVQKARVVEFFYQKTGNIFASTTGYDDSPPLSKGTQRQIARSSVRQ
jgi:hypothetical protein